MTFLRKLLPATLAAMLGALAALPAARAADVMVLFDGSRSSSVAIGGTSKLNIARNAFSAVLGGAPADFRVGVAVYGTIADSCSASSHRVIRAPGTPAQAIAAAGEVSPIGRGPLAEGAVTAAAAFADPDAPATLIIITDNQDNCAPDPCAVISALHERMPNLVISVLGLGVPSDEASALSCFAEITGGVFLRANDAAGFRANLAQVLEAAWAVPVPPPEPLPTATLTVPEAVIQGQPFEVAYEGPLGEGDQIRISWYGTTPEARLVGAFVKSDGAPVTLTAPAERGAYEIRYWNAERRVVLASARLSVREIAASLDAPDRVQQGGVIVVGWTAPLQNGDTIQLATPLAPIDRPLAEEPLRRNESTVTFLAPATPGRYEIRLVRPEPPAVGGAIRGAPEDRIIETQTIDVIPAAVTMQADVGGIVAGARFGVQWSGPGGPNDEIRLAVAGSPPEASVAVARPERETVTFVAPFPAGRYELRYWSAAVSAVVATVPVDIVAPVATLDAPAEVMAGATLTIDWTGPGHPGDRIAIAAAGAADTEAAAEVRVSAFGRAAVVDAPATEGAYELRYIAQGQAVLARRAITVTGSAVTMSVAGPIQAGTPFRVTWTGPGGQFDEIRLTRVLDDVSRAVASVRLVAGTTATLVAPAEPGVFVLNYVGGSSGLVLGAASIEVVCDGCAPAIGSPAALRP
ncbi:MAG: hypothetical protein KIT43_16490 [Bauldia sp.]|nr:hypothetical protein [Bauldia sp.]